MYDVLSKLYFLVEGVATDVFVLKGEGQKREKGHKKDKWDKEDNI